MSTQCSTANPPSTELGVETAGCLEEDEERMGMQYRSQTAYFAVLQRSQARLGGMCLREG